MSKEAQTDVKLEDIVSLAKRRGFIYQGSEVYGGLAGTWDYGPLGVQLKRNIMNLWWKTFVEDRDDMYGVDAAILMNQKVWQASGHAATFTDPLVDCGVCKNRFRVDHLIPEINKYSAYLDKVEHELKIEESNFNKYLVQKNDELGDMSELLNTNVPQYLDFHKFDEAVENKSIETNRAIQERNALNQRRLELQMARHLSGLVVQTYFNTYIKCPVCGSNQWGVPRQFNMMFATNAGPVMDADSVVYLRPETAQGIFTNFKNIVDSFYPDLPFGLAQQGKAFRNEISPRDFVFRSREFEQMEIEYFINEKDWEKEFEKWVKDIESFLNEIGLPSDRVHKLEVPDNDRAHYSKRTIDFEFGFPIGKEELLGLAYRTDFDLMNIQKASGKSMEYRPKDGSEPFVPHVIEPSFGVERMVMAVLSSAYTEDEVNGEKRSYLKLPAHLAPVKVAVSPLLKNKPELVAKAKEVYNMLKKEYGNVMWDDNGNIGKRYRRQDEIGTPYCITIDFDTLEDNTVTVRHRDTTKQDRVELETLLKKLS